jgi:hypothetical protein
MMIHTVISPDILTPENFDDPIYRQNVEIFLMGILSNGTIIVDQKMRLRAQLKELSLRLGTSRSGENARRLFEEILKKDLFSSTRKFLPSECETSLASDEKDQPQEIAISCVNDAFITRSSSRIKKTNSSSFLLDISSYGSSDLERKRRNFAETDFPTCDKMEPSLFEDIIIRATRYSKRLRFYDSMIGRGSRLPAFSMGIAKIIQLWLANCHYPKPSLSAEIYTTSHKPTTSYGSVSKNTYQVIKKELCDSLRDEHGIPIRFFFKFDRDKNCHARHLQSDYCIILFERGFDIYNDRGKMRRCFINHCPQGDSHLNDYRNLPEDRQVQQR